MQVLMIKKSTLIKHIVFALIIAAGVSAFFAAHRTNFELPVTKVYFVDADMMRLIPVKTPIPRTSTQRTAQHVLDALIEGHDNNPKIRRLIPNEKDCLTVRVKDEIAYVNISAGVIDAHPDGRDSEILTVYSIVNSLTELDGITNVRFTIDGTVQKNFMGHLDMRETFSPDYFV